MVGKVESRVSPLRAGREFNTHLRGVTDQDLRWVRWFRRGRGLSLEVVCVEVTMNVGCLKWFSQKDKHSWSVCWSAPWWTRLYLWMCEIQQPLKSEH
jgi:hypothetical protein